VNDSLAHSILLVSLIKVLVLLFLVLTAVAYLVWFERKVAARIALVRMAYCSRWRMGPSFS
jgi:NADH:ubiquinone oxidoreductase subunit H